MHRAEVSRPAEAIRKPMGPRHADDSESWTLIERGRPLSKTYRIVRLLRAVSQTLFFLLFAYLLLATRRVEGGAIRRGRALLPLRSAARAHDVGRLQGVARGLRVLGRDGRPHGRLWTPRLRVGVPAGRRAPVLHVPLRARQAGQAVAGGGAAPGLEVRDPGRGHRRERLHARPGGLPGPPVLPVPLVHDGGAAGRLAGGRRWRRRAERGRAHVSRRQRRHRAYRPSR